MAASTTAPSTSEMAKPIMRVRTMRLIQPAATRQAAPMANHSQWFRKKAGMWMRIESNM